MKQVMNPINTPTQRFKDGNPAAQRNTVSVFWWMLTMRTAQQAVGSLWLICRI
ncbi:hypothetical protein P2E39_04980 [Mannheimia haemolytica]|nr:hypothetical protein [Mannheimia haemolytica]MDW0425049.1 hypothetical protein [Mannheimia haemolytica]